MMARNPEFKAPQGVTVKRPENAGLFGEEPAAFSVPAAVEWLDVPPFQPEHATATNQPYPFNGEPVWLTPDGVTEFLAIWRVTREYRDGRFQPTAFWAVHNGGGQKIGFDPLGYRRYEAPLFVPAKRA